MRARGNQLLIQILLMIIITVIVAYTCMNLRCNSSYSGLLKAVK